MFSRFCLVAVVTILGAAQARADGWYNVQLESGMDCTGAAASDTAWNNAKAAHSALLVPEGCIIVFANDNSLSSAKSLQMLPGARLRPNSGKTITINGNFSAGVFQVFDGSGAVIGLRDNVPEWFGCANTGPNGGVDDQPCFVKVIASYVGSGASVGGRPRVLLQNGYGVSPGYYIKSCIPFTVNGAIDLVVEGGNSTQGANIWAASVAHGWSGNCAMSVTRTGSNSAVHFELRNFQIYNEDSANAVRCLVIGSGGGSASIAGLTNSIIENVSCGNPITAGVNNGFPTGIRIVNTRLVKIQNVGVWVSPATSNATALIFDLEQNGDFTGDAVVEDSQFVCDFGHSNFGVQINAQKDSSSGIAGIKFQGTVLYHCDVQVYAAATSGSNISNIWFERGEWDGTAGIGFLATTDNVAGGTICTNRSCISDINITDVYMQGYTGNALQLTAGKPYSIMDISVNGGYLNGFSDRFVAASGVAGFVIGSGIKFGNISPGHSETMYFVDSASITTNGINAWNHFGGVQASYLTTLDGTTNGFCPGTNTLYAYVSTFTRNIGSGTTVTCNTP